MMTPRRLRAVLATTAVAGLLLPLGPAPALGHTADSNTDGHVISDGPGESPTQWESAGLRPGAYQVTLITGDTVSVVVDGEGRSVVETESEERPDGSKPAIAIRQTDDAIYAVPDDVVPLLGSDRIDEELFNVSYLAANGYADQEQAALPVIVEYAREADEDELIDQAEELPGSTKPAVGLESVKSAGVGLKKSKLSDAWAKLHPTSKAAPASRLVPGVQKIWLDRKVEVTLDKSVPLIGAPEAWGAGFDGNGVKVAVLDTGIDETHPDVAGKDVASKSFIPNQAVADGHGHGTHVATTIAGSGAASGGKYKGVAPGADLVIGKVLNNSGSGTLAQIVDGMEWAAGEQDADVISMSLGARANASGSDLMTEAVERLTSETGALFVIAAGNSGPGDSTILTPGVAASALTVAATDKGDALASFSSRGPLTSGDNTLKPDISGPGVGITAARADGTALGGVVEEHYTTISGTSMATPHVAGAAAILLQKYPDWSASQLKPALMSTSAPAARLVGEITSGPYRGAVYSPVSGHDTRPITEPISGTPKFVGDACSTLAHGDGGTALIERGTCPFQTKLENVEAAGYDAGIVFNEIRQDCATLGTMQASGDIPFVLIDRLAGLRLLQEDDVDSINACVSASPDAGSSVASTVIKRDPLGYTAYEVGAGRVDVQRATEQDVFASTSSLDFKNVPPGAPPANKTVTYSNISNQPVTLDLSATARPKGGSTSGSLLTVEPATLTVPAGGSADATVTLTIADGGAGVYTGAVVATGPEGVRLSTPVGFTSFVELTVTVKSRQQGAVVGGQCATIDLFGVDGGGIGQRRNRTVCWAASAQQHSETFLLASGTYFAAARTQWQDTDGTQSAYLLNPEVTLENGAEVVLDSDDAQRVSVSTPKPAEFAAQTFALRRESIEGSFFSLIWEDVTNLWLTPTERVTKGRFVFNPMWALTSTDKDQSVYLLKPRFDRVPSPPHFAFSKKELALVNNHLYADPGINRLVLHWISSPRGGGHATGVVGQFPAQQTIPVFMGPISADNVHLIRLLDGNGQAVLESGTFVYDKPITYDEQWGKRPVVPGPVKYPNPGLLPLDPSIAVLGIQGGRCSGCREGETFQGVLETVTPDGRRSTGTVIGTGGEGPAEDALKGQHLYRDGQEIPGYVHDQCDGVHHPLCSF